MTIEQFEQANDIYQKINTIRYLQDEQNKNWMSSFTEGRRLMDAACLA